MNKVAYLMGYMEKEAEYAHPKLRNFAASILRIGRKKVLPGQAPKPIKRVANMFMKRPDAAAIFAAPGGSLLLPAYMKSNVGKKVGSIGKNILNKTK